MEKNEHLQVRLGARLERPSRFYEKKEGKKTYIEQRFSSVSFAEALGALTTESVYNCLASEVFPVGTHR